MLAFAATIILGRKENIILDYTERILDMTKTELLLLYCSAIHDENMLILKILEGFLDEKSQKIVESCMNKMNDGLNNAIVDTLSPVTISEKYTS